MPEMVKVPGEEASAMAKVIAAQWTDAQTGTRGLALSFELAEGSKVGKVMRHVLWVTDGTKNRVADTLKILGVDIDNLPHSEQRKLRETPGLMLAGARCLLVCEYEEANKYHRDPEWRVKWINEPRAQSSAIDPIDMILGRDKLDDRQTSIATQDYDDDVPF